MLGMRNIQYKECLGCGSWGCGMFRMWDVWDMGVQVAGCSRCDMFAMRDVWDVGCLGNRMLGMWDAGM